MTNKTTSIHFTRCTGMNCGATDANHSPECRAEHAAAVAGGRFVKGDAPIAPRAKYDPATQPGSPEFDGAEAYQAHLEAMYPDEAAPRADADTAGAKQQVTLTGAQLLEAFDFVAPDHPSDPEQLECEVTIAYGEGHDGKGHYCWSTDYPDEGAILLDGKSAESIAAGASNERADAAPNPSDKQEAVSRWDADNPLLPEIRQALNAEYKPLFPELQERADAEKDAALGDMKILEIADRFNFSGINDEIIDFARAILAAKEKKS